MWTHSGAVPIPPRLSSATHTAAKLRLQSDNECVVGMVFKQPNALFVFPLHSPMSVLSAVIGVFLCVSVFRDTPSPKLGMQVFLCVCVSASVTHFLSLTLFFPFLLPLFNVCLFPPPPPPPPLLCPLPLLPQGLCAFLPGGAEVSVIQPR